MFHHVKILIAEYAMGYVFDHDVYVSNYIQAVFVIENDHDIS